MNFLKVVNHPLIAELVQRGVVMTIIPEGVSIEGFYKSGSISLTMNEFGHIFAHSRYGESVEIRTLEDLVGYNLVWWRYSKDRSPAWSIPTEPWASMAVEFKFLTRIEKTVVEYK